MLQRRIIIPTDRDGEPVGAQIKAILDRHVNYRVAVVELYQPVAAADELVIPVVPGSLPRAEHVLSELHARHTGIPVLPVVRPENLSRIETLCPWVGDFLVRRGSGIPRRQTEDPADGAIRQRRVDRR